MDQVSYSSPQRQRVPWWQFVLVGIFVVATVVFVVLYLTKKTKIIDGSKCSADTCKGGTCNGQGECVADIISCTPGDKNVSCKGDTCTSNCPTCVASGKYVSIDGDTCTADCPACKAGDNVKCDGYTCTATCPTCPSYTFGKNVTCNDDNCTATCPTCPANDCSKCPSCVASGKYVSVDGDSCTADCPTCKAGDSQVTCDADSYTCSSNCNPCKQDCSKCDSDCSKCDPDCTKCPQPGSDCSTCSGDSMTSCATKNCTTASDWSKLDCPKNCKEPLTCPRGWSGQVPSLSFTPFADGGVCYTALDVTGDKSRELCQSHGWTWDETAPNTKYLCCESSSDPTCKS